MESIQIAMEIARLAALYGGLGLAIGAAASAGLFIGVSAVEKVTGFVTNAVRS